MCLAKFGWEPAKGNEHYPTFWTPVTPFRAKHSFGAHNFFAKQLLHQSSIGDQNDLHPTARACAGEGLINMLVGTVPGPHEGVCEFQHKIMISKM